MIFHFSTIRVLSTIFFQSGVSISCHHPCGMGCVRLKVLLRVVSWSSCVHVGCRGGMVFGRSCHGLLKFWCVYYLPILFLISVSEFHISNDSPQSEVSFILRKFSGVCSMPPKKKKWTPEGKRARGDKFFVREHVRALQRQAEARGFQLKVQRNSIISSRIGTDKIRSFTEMPFSNPPGPQVR